MNAQGLSFDAMIEQVWPHCAPHIQAALDVAHNVHGLEDVRRRIDERRAQLWPTPNGALVTEVNQLPNARVLRFWLAGGALDDLLLAERVVTQWAREEEGCTAAEIIGRTGWRKVLADRGYHRDAELLWRDL